MPKKLEELKVCPLIQQWIKNWLACRKQRVVVRGSKSSWLPVTSGVPQGSVLGQILVLVYINDLEDGVSSSNLKFADDTKIFRTIKSESDVKILQQDLQKNIRMVRILADRIQYRQVPCNDVTKTEDARATLYANNK